MIGTTAELFPRGGPQALVGAILTVIFGGLWMHFRVRGGYRAVHIAGSSTSGVEHVR